MIEGVTPAPAVSCATPVPVIEHVTPAPGVTYTAPARVIGNATHAPSVTCTTPAPVTDYVTPSPVIVYISDSIGFVNPQFATTAVEASASESASSAYIPAPLVLKEMAEVVQVIPQEREHVTPGPAVDIGAPAPVIEDVTPEPDVAEETTRNPVEILFSSSTSTSSDHFDEIPNMLDSCIWWLSPLAAMMVESIREGDRANCTACQTDGGARTGSFETPQTNTIYPFAWDHGESDVPNPMRVGPYAANLTPAVRWHRQESCAGYKYGTQGQVQ